MTNLLLWSLQASVLIALAALVAVGMRTARPAARLALWQFTLFATLLLPVLRPWQRAVVTGFAMPPHTFSAVPSKQVPYGPAPILPTPTEALEYLLAAGIALKLAHLALGLFRLRQYRRESRLFRTSAFWRTEAEILISDAVPSPVTFGFLNPVILLPGHFASLDAPLRETILYHEILHVRRRDWLFTVAEEVVRSVLWFHPAIWWTVREIQLAREEAVDREVVETLNAREAYVDALLAIAGRPLGGRWTPAPFPAPFFARRKQLKQRVISIFREVNMSNRNSVSALLAGCCALALSCWLITGALPLRAAPQEVIDGPGVMVETNGARLMHRPPVRYPDGVTVGGAVTAQVRTNGNGSVVDANIVAGPDQLRKTVLQSLLDWHFTRDSANATRQVTITFTPPKESEAAPVTAAGAPASVARVAAQPAMAITAIEVQGLSDNDRDELIARLPAHVGDTWSPELRNQLESVAHDFDEHLSVGMLARMHPDGTHDLTVRISLAQPQAFPVTGAISAVPPRPADLPPAPEGSVRLGGNVAAVNLLNQTKPEYPPLAKAARVQGTVELQAIIGKDGTVQNLHLISGPPLLVHAAMQAVQQWVYKPVKLNGQPVEVVTTVSVNFELAEN